MSAAGVTSGKATYPRGFIALGAKGGAPAANSPTTRPAEASGARCHRVHKSCILVHMRTTLNLNDELVEKAREFTGIREKTALVHAGLEALIAREAARRLAALGGSQPGFRAAPRRRLRRPR